MNSLAEKRLNNLFLDSINAYPPGFRILYNLLKKQSISIRYSISPIAVIKSTGFSTSRLSASLTEKTLSGSTGLLVNGVEILNYKSDDRVTDTLSGNLN